MKFSAHAKRRSFKAVALVSAGMLVLSGLSISALTAGIEIAPTAVGQPAHLYHEDGQLRRGPVPRAAFPGLPARGQAVFGGDRVYDIDVAGKSYRVHEFATVGTATLRVQRSIAVEYLLVGGGGGGGAHVGGGGGGGGVLTGTVTLDDDAVIVVGGGGTGAVHYGVPGNTNVKLAISGDSSKLGDLEAFGGGHGGSWDWQAAGTGGSGGGSATTTGAQGTSGQGTNGGAGRGTADNGFPTGGGGGAGGAGGDWSTTKAGDGGGGLASTITGVEVRYGGGGGGGIHGHHLTVDAAPGVGQDGGGDGVATVSTLQPQQHGTHGLGGGGGGGGQPDNTTSHGGNGGSGMVIVRYEISRAAWTPVSGVGGNSVQEVTIDGVRYREHRFTTVGTHTLDLSVADPARQVEMLLVGGGGGGGSDSGGGGGGGGLLEGRLNFAEAGERTVTITVGAGGARGRWTGPSGFAGKGGSSVVSMQRGATTEFVASVAGGVGGPNNDRNTTNTNGGNNTGAGGVSPAAPALSGGATWQSVQSKSGGAGGPASGPGYETRPRNGQPAPSGGGESTLFGGSFSGGGGGGSSESTVTAAGTRGGGRGSGNSSGCAIELRATPGQPNTGGGGGGGAAYGQGTGCADSAGLNTRDGEPGGSGIVLIRYPITRIISSLPSQVRELVAAEGATTAQLRWRQPAIDPPLANSSGYRIEYSPINATTWTTVTTPVTFTTSGSGDATLITADVTGIPSGSRHRFRITPIGTVDGPSVIIQAVAKGGDSVRFVGDDVVHQYTTVGSANFALSEARTVEALVVGGGGGGGGTSWAGGGGGGRVLHGQGVEVAASDEIAVTVGAGGAGGKLNPSTVAERTGASGESSAFNGVIAAGGGGGGGPGWEQPTYVGQGNAGGSGGGTGEHGNNIQRNGQRLYETTNPTRSNNAIVYTSGFGNGTNDAAANFDRSSDTISYVTYRMEVFLNGVTRFAEVRFDAWSGLTARDLRVPDFASGNVFTLRRFVENMTVDSNMAAGVSTKSQGVVTGSGRRGYLEIWPRNYGAISTSDGPAGAKNDKYDFNDSQSGSGNYGSFQVHDVTTSGSESTVLAWNQHGVSTPDIGLGNYTGAHPDWTFSAANSLRTSSSGTWRLDIRANKDPLRTVLGGAASAATPPTKWSSFGNAGGAVHVVASQAGSGGGGAGAVGGDVPNTSYRTINGVLQPRVAGNGGAGRTFALTGQVTAYGGGGGGGTQKSTAADVCAQGGVGGGGAGACTGLGGANAVAGTNGLGGGGGGGHNAAGAPGGSGTVIVRYSFAGHLYAFDSFTFTNGTQTGRFGPSRANLLSSYDTNTHTWLSNTSYFEVNTGIQLWTVPQDGRYRIVAAGAEGGQGESSLVQGKPIRTGKGAVIAGDFDLTQGQVLKILVGQRGSNGGAVGGNYSGGGGGGTFVTTLANSPLVVAGGGSGENWGSWNTGGPDGRSDNNNVTGGTAGGSGERGAGGAGLTGNGGNATTGNATGGVGFTSGGAGGAEDTSVRGGHGGFGGGGGGRWEGGGGGGYSGARVVSTNQYNSTFPTFGAGSFNSGINQVSNAGANSGHGSVTITRQ